MTPPENILLIDKPTGVTSFDVIRKLRSEYKEKVRMGHAGTLDPLASGLMVIGVGKGTKKLKEYIGLDKEYFAEILVGEKRSTGDMEGKVIEEKAVEEIFSEEKISSTLASMVSTLRLPVSAYSAVKKGGVPMYKRARQAEKIGEVVKNVPIRDMIVHEAKLVSIEPCIINDTQKLAVEVRFKVGSGTYIRSLAEEFGKRLSYPATLKNLRRTKVGEFDIKDALTL